MSKSKAVPEGSVHAPIPKLNRGVKWFFSEVVREMKKVNWPSPKETNRLTGVVLVVCGLVVGLLMALNFAWGEIVGFLTKRGTL